MLRKCLVVGRAEMEIYTAGGAGASEKVGEEIMQGKIFLVLGGQLQ